MRTKFEKNVASDMPKTKALEPDLPWKVSGEDLAEIKEPLKSRFAASIEEFPLKARAIFLILLVVVIFAASFYLVTGAVLENENMRLGMSANKLEITALKTDIQKVSGEKNYLAENFSQLEKRVSDLTAQKELFTAVIESLTAKPNEAEIDREAGWRKILDS